MNYFVICWGSTFIKLFLGLSFAIIWGIVIWMLKREFASDVAEIRLHGFGINSLFIVIFAPVFQNMGIISEPSGPIKFAIGLILLGLDLPFYLMVQQEPLGASTASVSITWLIMAYLFHTLGELCISPVGLSYVSKLAPKADWSYVWILVCLQCFS